MRRDLMAVRLTRVLGGVATAVLVCIVAGPVIAAPTPNPVATTAAPVPGTAVCAINRPGLEGVSGLVARADGYVVVNTGAVASSEAKIFFLGADCKLRTTVPYPTVANDPEDLAQAADGTLWAADIGDASKRGGVVVERRKTVALWTLAPGANQRPVVHRFAYPDGAHDAEALLLNGDGNPIIITKETDKTSAPAGLYVPAAAVQSNNPSTAAVPLRRAGEFKPPMTDTPNPLSTVGRLVVTGGAVSPDHKRVTLRTYADAFEWDVPDGDVVKAITTGKPRITPLPNEPQGEAIAYTTDGHSFVTVSNLTEQAAGMPILRYTPRPEAATTAPAAVTAAAASRGPWWDRLTFQDIMYVIAGVGVFGLLLVLVGVVGIRRSREARRAAASAAVIAGAVAAVRGGSNAPGPPEREDSDKPAAGGVTPSSEPPAVATAAVAPTAAGVAAPPAGAVVASAAVPVPGAAAGAKNRGASSRPGAAVGQASVSVRSEPADQRRAAGGASGPGGGSGAGGTVYGQPVAPPQDSEGARPREVPDRASGH